MSTPDTGSTVARRGSFLKALDRNTIFEIVVHRPGKTPAPAFARIGTVFDGYSMAIGAQKRAAVEDALDLTKVASFVLWHDGRPSSATVDVPGIGYGLISVSDTQGPINIQETDPASAAFGVNEDRDERPSVDQFREAREDARAIEQEPEDRPDIGKPGDREHPPVVGDPTDGLFESVRVVRELPAIIAAADVLRQAVRALCNASNSDMLRETWFTEVAPGIAKIIGIAMQMKLRPDFDPAVLQPDPKAH